MIKRVLVALDGSEHADRAIALGCEIARRFDAELIALHVVSDKPLSDAEHSMAETEFQAEIGRSFDAARLGAARGDDMLLMSRQLAEQAAIAGGRFRRALGERLLDDAAQRARESSVKSVRPMLREGDPAAAILRAAADEATDLIVMGRRGRGDLAGLLLGSVSHKVAHLAECACLTVK
jgi:nucleotide-binding universal stress UspA family protein